ncbi:MAG: DUF885 family protein [Candidatus Omnitrophica bacterium]|nr:DUF885 family protein [Candidatus Omnitrophota bacterium]
MRKVGLRKNLLSRMKQLPRLIGEAKVNLKEVPGLYIKTGIEMVNSTIDYLRNFDASPLIKNTKSNKELLSIVRNAVGELCSFKVFLSEKGASGTALKGRQELEDILNNSFSYNRSLEEIFDIARLEYDNTIKELEHAAGKIGSRKKWQNILSEYCLDAKNKKELLNYYAEQIDRLKTFFTEKDLVTIPKSQTILARETPPFLIPVRASASYSCPVTNDMKEPAFFYVTAKYAKFDKPTDRRAKSIHNEYIFISAHETYIGHHLLDTHRRQLKNPIRRQVESALFYEGWASYAEWFIASLGYIKGPLQRMVGLKRRAWRAIRAMLDAGVRINKISLEDAKRMLSDLGYEPDIVKSMVDHYILTPGYQLCYTVGKFEIEQLKNRFSHTMGLKKFHDALLESGEAPFDLIKERMDKLICKDSF